MVNNSDKNDIISRVVEGGVKRINTLDDAFGTPVEELHTLLRCAYECNSSVLLPLSNHIDMWLDMWKELSIAVCAMMLQIRALSRLDKTEDVVAIKLHELFRVIGQIKDVAAKLQFNPVEDVNKQQINRVVVEQVKSIISAWTEEALMEYASNKFYCILVLKTVDIAEKLLIKIYVGRSLLAQEFKKMPEETKASYSGQTEAEQHFEKTLDGGINYMWNGFVKDFERTVTEDIGAVSASTIKMEKNQFDYLMKEGYDMHEAYDKMLIHVANLITQSRLGEKPEKECE